jgi:hypothetical protein
VQDVKVNLVLTIVCAALSLIILGIVEPIAIPRMLSGHDIYVWVVFGSGGAVLLMALFVRTLWKREPPKPQPYKPPYRKD